MLMPQKQRAAIALLALFVLWCGWQSKLSSKGPSTQSQSTAKSDDASAYHPKEKNWWNDATADFTLGLIFVGLFQAGLFWVQLGFIRESLRDAEKGVKAAQDAADAAKLNAEAVMSAEGAHLYPVVAGNNLYDVFMPIIWYPESGQDSDAVPQPTVTFRFKNYGKTPAVLISVMYGIDFYVSPSKLRTMHAEDISFIEVIGPDQETREITVELLGSTFTRGKAKSVREGPGQLLFFGQAIFKDFFNRQFLCIWECEGDPGGFRLIRHEQRENPDAKG
jgi:hypothetical protein